MLAKQKTNQRFIFKINSSRLRKSKWNLTLTIPEAIKNEELISLADSTTLRFINEGKNIDSDANFIRKQIKTIKKLESNLDNRKKIKTLYANLYNALFIKDYVCIVIDKMKDFDTLNRDKGFFINGVKFKRLLTTNGGGKNSTVIYVSLEIHEKLNNKLDNGRDLTKPIVPGKFEAYKGLPCSASIPVSDPKGIIVIKDCETEFLSNVITLDDNNTLYPKLTYEKDYLIKLVENDGYGMIHPDLSLIWAKELGEDYIASGFCERNSFCKGMFFTMDFIDFADKIAKSYIVKDAWGADRDIRNVQLVLTTSMLKLWDSYNSMEHYLECCKDNGYTFSVTKITPEKLENERNLNYQFIQSYELSDDDIEELIQPTVQEIKDVLGNDPIKSILFLKGVHISEDSYNSQDSDFIKALMIDKSMINDPFVRNKIHNMIKKRINEAKIGVLKVKGNFSTVSGDPYSLCQSMFGLEVTGLLKSGEFYSKYWNDKNVEEVVCYRAPMTCHNNIRILRFKNTEEMQYWYKYMNTVTIFNSWDTTSHALNGLDKDADAVMTTNNPVLLRNTRELDAVICIQKVAEKKIITEELLIQANKDCFGDAIGSITNKVTGMIDVISGFEKDSKEHEELEYRIICGQNYQQNAIDKLKGIISKPLPKEWYDYFTAKDMPDKEFQLSILADKKPYFFIYNYPYVKKKYKKYINNTNKNCLMRFGIDVKELISKEIKTEEEDKFIYYYYRKMPVFINKSTMNRICWIIEQEFDGYKSMSSGGSFDYKILMSEEVNHNKMYSDVKTLYEEYTARVRQYAQTFSTNKLDKEDKQNTRNIFKNDFKDRAHEICVNNEELCNIVIDLCYKNNLSKQFAWDICGKSIIDNLLRINDYNINYPIRDINGTVEYGGELFSIHIENLNREEEDFEINIK